MLLRRNVVRVARAVSRADQTSVEPRVPISSGAVSTCFQWFTTTPACASDRCTSLTVLVEVGRLLRFSTVSGYLGSDPPRLAITTRRGRAGEFRSIMLE